MDWRTILDERNKRSTQSKYGGFMPSASVMAESAPPVDPNAQEDTSFFGQLGKGVGDTANFFGGLATGIVNMPGDIIKKANDAIGGIANVVGETFEAGDLQKHTDELNAINKQVSDYQANLQPTDYDKPEVQAKLAEFQSKAKTVADAGKAIVNSDGWKASQNTDATKTAATAAETFLNAVGLAGLATAAGKAIVTKGAEVLGKDIAVKSAEDIAANAAENMAIQGAKRTAVGAAKTIGTNIAEGGLFGAGYGALQPLEQTGKDTKMSDVWGGALTGGAIGGAFGGALTLLDKNVRAGLKQMPAEMKTNVVNTAAANAEPQVMSLGKLTSYEGAPDRATVDLYKQKIAAGEQLDPIIAMRDSTGNLGVEDGKHRLQAYMESGIKDAPVKVITPGDVRAVTQGGYIKLPGSAMDESANAAEMAQKQLAGENIAQAPISGPNEQLIQAEAARVATPEDYAKEMTDYIWGKNKKGAGVVTNQFEDLTPGQGGDSYTARRISQNEPFYRAFYEQYGSKPTKKEITNLVDRFLNGEDNIAKFEIDPSQRDVYSLIKDRVAGIDRAVETGPPSDLYNQFANDAGIPAKPTVTAPATNMAATATQTPPLTFEASQRALNGQVAAETNPLIDYIDPQTIPSPQTRVGVQTGMPTDIPNPYADMPQNLNAPALPAGTPPTVTPAAARRLAKAGKEPVDVLNTLKPGTKPIELGANTADLENVAIRETPGGKLKPIATNNAHVTKDELAAIKAISEDNRAGKFTITRTPEMNLEEALAKRGGANSQEFKVLNTFNTDLREAKGRISDIHQADAKMVNDFADKYKWTAKMDDDPLARQFMEASDQTKTAEILKQFTDKYGQDAGAGLMELKSTGTQIMADRRLAANANIIKHAGEDRAIGELENYWPRANKQGIKGMKDWVSDLRSNGLKKFMGKGDLLNLSAGEDNLNKITNVSSDPLRQVNQAPLNSDLAKPNTSFLSQAQHRTAVTAQGEQMGVLRSMDKYLRDVTRAGELTPSIAKGRSLQKAVELVNGEAGNLRQMYDSLGDQVNAISGKTNRLDQMAVNSEFGNKALKVATTVQAHVSKSTILGSANSALAQTGQLPLIAAETGPKNFAGGMADTIKYAISGDADNPLRLSSLLKDRYSVYDKQLILKTSEKAGHAVEQVISKPFRLIEEATTNLTWFSNYRKVLADGAEPLSKQAINEADRLTAKIIGERSAGARAALYESKVATPITAYTLEVNQLYQMAKQYIAHDPKKAMALVGALWLYNQGYKAITGNRLNADPLAAGIDAAGILAKGTDANGDPIGLGERLMRAGGRMAGEAIDATPIGGQIVGNLYPSNGIRVPFGSGARMLSRADIFGDTSVGRYNAAPPISAGVSNPLLLLGIPGMAQLQRGVEGNAAYNQGASNSPSGNLRFSIKRDPENYWRSLLFGPYGTREGSNYLNTKSTNLAG